KSYYSETSVDPVGPVTIAGQYTLSSATVAEAATQTLNSGVTLTPKAKVKSGYYESDAPADAKLTFTWYSSDNKTDWTEVTENVDATTKALTLTDALVGRYVKLDANSLDNTVSWISSNAVNKAGEYNLLRVTTTPYATSSTTQLVTGDSVSASVQAIRIDGGTSYGVDVTDKVAIQWLVSDTADGDYTSLEDLSGKQVTLPDAASGKFLKVQVTSGTSTVEAKFANSVLDKDSLAALVQKMNDGYYRPGLTYGGESNLNKVVAQDIKDKYSTEGVSVKVKSVKFAASDAKATVGISSADDETNGDVTWFYIDPNDYSGWSMTQLYNATVTLELTKGDETVEYSPRSFSVPWDEDKLVAAMNEAGKAIAIGYSTGDSAESVTSKLTLPYKAGSNKKYSVTWESSSDNITVSGYGWDDYTGTVERTAYDVNVTLTATIKVTSGADGIETTVDFPVTVKGDPEKVKEEISKLESNLENNFTDANITYATSGDKANLAALDQDIKLPRPTALGVDGKYYEVKYTIGETTSGTSAGLSDDSSSDPIVVNGYRGNVYQPLPGESAAKTKITCTITSKANSEITASKTLDATVIPLEQSAIDAEVALMAQAKAGYADAILEGQSADAVTNNLHAFKKAYLKDGQLAWAYNTTTGDGVDGITTTDLPGYDSMGTQGWRTFKSSKPNVVSHENLLVTQPTYNTKVTITSSLSSEKFARYAERYPENATFASLANQEVTANITVAGSTGQDDPNAGKQITVNAKVTAVSETDEQGKYTDIVVAPLTEFTLDYDSTPNAEDVLEQLMTKAGCTNLVSGAWGLTSATLPDGRTPETTSTAPYSYWSFFVNNEYATVGAPSYYLNDGDTVEFRYIKGDGEKQDSGTVDVNPDAQGPDWSSEWPSYNKGDGAVTDASTPTGQTKEEWTFDYKAYIQHQWPNASEPIIAGDYIYLAVDNRLLQIDKSNGTVLKAGKLAGHIGYTTRPVYTNGLIIVPLDGGSVQALTADSFETKWVTEEINDLVTQSNSTIAVNGNYIYIGTVDVNYSTSTYNNGHFTKININTGAIAWQNVDENEGYYWGGAAFKGDYVVVSTSAGTVKVFNNNDGSEVSTLSLGALVNSDCVIAPDGESIMIMTRDGKLNLVSVDESGEATLTNSFDLGLSDSASTPVVSGNNVYVGGETNDRAGSALAVVTFNNGTPSSTLISSADGSELPSGGIKGAPLVSVQNGETYVYFTVNNATSSDRGKTYSSGGGIYRYKVGDSEAKLIYDAAGHNQYCDSPVICDANGVLYYINDSCTLFAISASDSVDPTPTPDPTPAPDSGEGDEGSSDATKNDGTVYGRYALVATSRLKVAATTNKFKDNAQTIKQANSSEGAQQPLGNQAEEPAQELANASEPVTQNLIFLTGGLILLIIAIATVA
ncbi:MAG: DUF4430 domain-containing protein, partial [Phoenicibacter congonensis]|nr:DUF4430 domain-containing protein [Phoenicibacter congonensis]